MLLWYLNTIAYDLHQSESLFTSKENKITICILLAGITATPRTHLKYIFDDHINFWRFSGTPVTPGRLTNRTPFMTGTPGGITPGAMSMAAGTPYGTTPIGGYGAVNTPYTPSGQTPMMTPYTTPRAHGSGASTPRQRPTGMTPSRHSQHPLPSHSMPPPTSGGSTPMARSGRSYQPSPIYGSSSGGSGYGRSPSVRGGERGGWQAAEDAWARGSSRRTPRTNDGGQTPKGSKTCS